MPTSYIDIFVSNNYNIYPIFSKNYGRDLRLKTNVFKLDRVQLQGIVWFKGLEFYPSHMLNKL